MKHRLLPLLLIFAVAPLFCEQRGFDDIFPGLPEEIRAAAFSGDGYIKSREKSAGFNLIDSTLDPQIAGGIINRQPAFVIESLLVIPANRTLLEVYNALAKIRGLKGRLYHSFTRDESIPLFEDATRIESARKTTPIADPPPAASLPQQETIYLRLNDVNFGASYYRADVSFDQHGLHYDLANNRNLTYLFIPVIKEEKFTIRIYFEPVQEGVLLYSIAGVDVSDFVANRIDMPSAIAKRLRVIISWVADGLKNGN